MHHWLLSKFAFQEKNRASQPEGLKGKKKRAMVVPDHAPRQLSIIAMVGCFWASDGISHVNAFFFAAPGFIFYSTACAERRFWDVNSEQ